MNKLLFTAAILFGLQLGFSDAPKAEGSKENTNPCPNPPCVTEQICKNTCMVCGCTEAEMEKDREFYRSIFCKPISIE